MAMLVLTRWYIYIYNTNKMKVFSRNGEALVNFGKIIRKPVRKTAKTSSKIPLKIIHAGYDNLDSHFGKLWNIGHEWTGTLHLDPLFFSVNPGFYGTVLTVHTVTVHRDDLRKVLLNPGRLRMPCWAFLEVARLRQTNLQLRREGIAARFSVNWESLIYIYILKVNEN